MAGALVEQHTRHCPVSDFVHTDGSHRWHLKVRSPTDGDSDSINGSIGRGSLTSLCDSSSPVEDVSIPPSPSIPQPSRPGSVESTHRASDDSDNRSVRSGTSPRRRTLGVSTDADADLVSNSLTGAPNHDDGLPRGVRVAPLNLGEGSGGGFGKLMASEPRSASTTGSATGSVHEDASSQGSPTRPSRRTRRLTSGSGDFHTADEAGGEEAGGEGDCDGAERDDEGDEDGATMRPRKRRGHHDSLVRLSSALTDASVETMLCSTASSVLREQGKVKLQELFDTLVECVHAMVNVRQDATTPCPNEKVPLRSVPQFPFVCRSLNRFAANGLCRRFLCLPQCCCSVGWLVFSLTLNLCGCVRWADAWRRSRMSSRPS